MRAKEFINEAPLYPETGYSIGSMAAKAGYEPVGKGYDATVYQHPKKKKAPVVKILLGMPGRSASRASRGFLAFYKFVKANPNHPNLPKFGKPSTYKIGKETVYSVPIEPLYKLDQDNPNDYYHLFVADLASSYTWPEMVKDLKSLPSNNWMFTTTRGKKLLQQLEIFYKLIKKCMDFADDIGVDLDMHEGNFMKRKDGTVVITDPYVL